MFKSVLIRIYLLIFAWPRCARVNRALVALGQRGLGVGNLQSDATSGEKSFLDLFLRKVPNAVVLDVGANEGRYAKGIRVLAAASRVYAFEPHPKTFARAKKLAREFGFEILNQGLSREPGKATLYDLSESGSEQASVYSEVITDLHRRPAHAFDITLTTLDQFLQERAISRVDLLKIDTEGHEMAVLEGAKKALSAGIIRGVHFEFNEMNVKSRVFMADFHRVLPGFHFFRLLPNSRLPLPVEPFWSEVFSYQNILAVSDELGREMGLLAPDR